MYYLIYVINSNQLVKEFKSLRSLNLFKNKFLKENSVNDINAGWIEFSFKGEVLSNEGTSIYYINTLTK